MTLMFVPIPHGEKGPNENGWNLEANCLKDFDSLAGMNMGVAHAYCSPSTCALDIDDFLLAERLLGGYSLDLMSLLKDPNAAVLHSGRRRSLKVIYKLPESVGRLVTKAVKTDDRVAYELRCAVSSGLTVTDVIPPSIHPQGTPYRWISDGLFPAPVKPTPSTSLWLVAKVRRTLDSWENNDVH
jgi:hypothetical protein